MADTTLSNDAVKLAELGYKQELKRHFALHEVFGISISMFVLVPGIASVLFISIPNGGPVGMVWGWLIASTAILTVCIAISELASAAPTAGGLYYWTHRFASPRWRNLLSWIVGYANTIYLMSGVASVAWSMALQVTASVTIGSKDQSFVATTAQNFGVFTAFIVVQACVASFGTKLLARMQNLVIAANVLLILGFILAITIATPKQFRNDAKFALTSFQNFNGWPDGYAFCMGFLTPLWVIASFDSPVHLSEEVLNADTAVPKANVGATIFAIIVGLAVNIAITFCMGSDLEGLLSDPTGQPMAAILRNSLGTNGVLVFFVFIISVLFLSEANLTAAASRQIFAFARDGALPLSNIIYKINPHTGTPVNAVWIVSFVGWLFGLLAFAGPAAITAVFALPIAAQYVTYIIPIVCRFVGENDYKPGPFSLGCFSLPINIFAVLWMVFMIVVFMFPVAPNATSLTMNWAIVCLGGWILISLVWYYFPVYGGVHWFKGPVANIDVRDLKVGEESNSEGSIEKESASEK